LAKHARKHKKGQHNNDKNNKKQLVNVRVIQRNLVYVTNLPMNVAKEDILKRHEYFGQYGKVLKIVINKSHLFNSESAVGPAVR
jgi:CCR4-NOT transcription complex subunit 4